MNKGRGAGLPGGSAPLRGKLLAWYGANRRRMPWRESPSPYRTWVSEIMLQQTQVATVIPYFERFMERFPDVQALAAAPEEDVLRHWAGLGYYSRARNLQKAAKKVVAELGGRLPEDAEGLRKLPGVGPYTAAAVASIAFGRPEELVDGNVARVLARLFAVRGDAKSPPVQRRLWDIARLLMKGGPGEGAVSRPGDWNQALMELGALVCLPSPEKPLCGGCPLGAECRALARGLQARLPGGGRKPAPVALAWTALLARRAGRTLLWRRDESERFLRGHWGLPEDRHLKAARPGRVLATVRHSITHHRITLTVREASISGAPLPPQARWVRDGELEDFLVSSLWRKAIRPA